VVQVSTSQVDESKEGTLEDRATRTSKGDDEDEVKVPTTSAYPPRLESDVRIAFSRYDDHHSAYSITYERQRQRDCQRQHQHDRVVCVTGD